MLAIHLNDPELEAFYQEELAQDAASLTQQFITFLKEQRIKRDVRQAQDEVERGEFLTIDEAFEQILNHYAPH